MKRCFGTFLMLLVFAWMPLRAAKDSIVLKNPEPNFTEDCYVQLVRAGEINEDLGNNEFLFEPSSVAMDRSGCVYIFDRMQAKIFKFTPEFKLIKTFGRQGEGPGEFRFKGRSSMPYITIGYDDKLYVHQTNSFKVLVFDREGNFLDQIKIAGFGFHNFSLPIVDAKGNLLIQQYHDKRLSFKKPNGEELFSIPHEAPKKEYLFIENQYERMPGHDPPFAYNFLELKYRLTRSNKILLFFALSSTLYILKDGEIENKSRIWPQNAVAYRKKEAEMKIRKKQKGYKPLFTRIICDGDNDELFYLYFGLDKERQAILLYQMGVDGRLKKVLLIPMLPDFVYPKLLLKQKGIFFVKDEEKLLLYREQK